MQSLQDILLEASSLKGQKLTQFVEEVISNPNVYIFMPFKQILQNHQIDQKHHVFQLLDLFMNETCYSRKNPAFKLTEKQLSKLKMLTILTLFEGMAAISIEQILKKMNINKKELMELLIQGNIAKIIKIEINQEKGMISIQGAKHRENSAASGEKLVRQGCSKIFKIQQKNDKVASEVNQLLEESRIVPKQYSMPLRKKKSSKAEYDM